jgi:outer membrane cobalamin receptor
MKRRFLGFASVILILFAIINSNALAQEAKDSKKKKSKEDDILHPHEVVVVTATATRKAVKDCSSSVSVVSSQDIRAISASNALNLLNFLPGVFVQRTGNFGRADVDIRGIGQRGQRINILVDGRPEKMGLYGCVVTHAFPLDNVERIEVVRGPSSVLYGSEAFGGVVNIITRNPEEGLETDLSASYGSFNTQQLNLRHGGKLKRWIYYLTFDRRRSDGHRENSSYNGNAFTGKLSYDFSDRFQLSLQGKYFDGKKYEAGTVDFPLSDFWNDYQRGAVDLTMKAGDERDEFFLKVYRNFGHHRFSDGWHSRDYINGGVLRYTTHRVRNNELVCGVDFRILGGKSYNWPQGQWDKNEAAVFVQDEYVVHQRWILSAGFRLHRDSLFGIEGCPHWGIVFKASEKTTLRASINKGFRSPQLNELYIFPAANPDLKPEKVWNYEVGFDQKISDWMSLGAAVYRMKGSSLIETAANPSPPPAFKFQNRGEFTFYGTELNLKAALSHSFSAFLFYTYLDPGEKTKGRAGQKWDFSLRFENDDVFASLQTQYVTDYYAEDFAQSRLPSYFLLNLRFEVNALSFLGIFIEMNNILDNNYLIYVDMPGIEAGPYPMPGRSLNIGFSIKQ